MSATRVLCVHRRFDVHSANVGAPGQLRPLSLDALERLHLSIDLSQSNGKEWSIRSQVTSEVLEVGLTLRPLIPETSNLVLLAGDLRGLGLANLGNACTGRLPLLAFQRVVVNPTMAAGHVVLAIVRATESIAWQRTIARRVLAQGFLVAVHLMRLALMAEQASSRGELQVGALVVAAAERFQMRIDVLAVPYQLSAQVQHMRGNILILALQHLWLVPTVFSGGKRAMVETIVRRTSIIQVVAAWRDAALV